MPTTRRVELLDLLRGAVILLMALDHTRDFFQPTGTNPENLDTTTLALFATRWVTHLCAPSFVFLAGVGMGLQVTRKGATNSLLRFFATRGLWLMLLECTWVTFSWYFDFHAIHLGVLWGIGGAMLLTAPFCRLSPRWSAAIGAVTLLVLTMIPPVKTGVLGFFLQPGSLMLGTMPVNSAYVIIPWWSVMMIGMAAASWFDSDEKAPLLRKAGMGLLVGFLVLRGFNLGDPSPWAEHPRGFDITALSFLRVSKYPPSLAYLCATLGTSFTLGSLLLWLAAPVRRVVGTFGRVPLFYYLIHLPFLHLLGVLYATGIHGTTKIPGDEPLSLSVIYAAWILASAALYWPCRAYDRAKLHHRKPWMRYL